MMFSPMIKLPFNNMFKEFISPEKDSLLKNFNDGIYEFYDNYCLCGNVNNKNDIILSQKDCIGVPITTLICKLCGLIRINKCLNNKSLSDFYKNYYNILYYKTDKVDDKLFEENISEKSRSYKLFSLVNKKGLLNDITNVFEIGCSAGWNLYPYHIRGKYTSGCDYRTDYISHGISRGMNLYEGELDTGRTKKDSQDLVILSHVLEHIAKPIEFLIEVIKIIKVNKYLIVEIPSVLSNKESTLVTTFHLPHIYTYNENYLISLFKALKLEVLYHDDESVFILRKPNSWSPLSVQEVIKYIPSDQLINDSDYIINHLKTYYIKAKFKIIVIKVLELFMIKKIVKYLLKY
jgi:SAM-dependent methyltransferase